RSRSVVGLPATELQRLVRTITRRSGASASGGPRSIAGFRVLEGCAYAVFQEGSDLIGGYEQARVVVGGLEGGAAVAFSITGGVLEDVGAAEFDRATIAAVDRVVDADEVVVLGEDPAFDTRGQARVRGLAVTREEVVHDVDVTESAARLALRHSGEVIEHQGDVESALTLGFVVGRCHEIGEVVAAIRGVAEDVPGEGHVVGTPDDVGVP